MRTPLGFEYAPPVTAIPTTLACDDVDELFLQSNSPREGECLQLDPGPLGLRARLTALPHLHIYTWQYGKRLLGREARHDGSLCILLRLDPGAPVRINGREVPCEQTLIRHGEELVEFVTPADMRCVEIDLSATLVDTFGWHPPAQMDVLPLSSTAVARLRRAALATVGFLDTRPELSEEFALVLRDRLLLTIGSCLSGVSELRAPILPTSRAAEIFREGNEYLASRDIDTSLRIGTMAAALDVSERTLYKAYSDWIGMGPYEFDFLRRMHVFRTELIRSPSRRGAVGRAARLAAFKDLSRLGSKYKTHFGEVPSATARRWRREWPDVLPPARSADLG